MHVTHSQRRAAQGGSMTLHWAMMISAQSPAVSQQPSRSSRASSGHHRAWERWLCVLHMSDCVHCSLDGPCSRSGAGSRFGALLPIHFCKG